MKKNLLLILSVLAFSPTFAQEQLKYCGADEMRISTLKQNPKIAQAVIKNDLELEQFTQNFVADFYSNRTSTATYIIPVVFHVIHNYGVENISAAQILDGLDILNKTFSKQLADTGSIVAAFKPLHANCDIEFRLAQLDPAGNCTSGINRIASSLTNIGDHSVKSLIQWPTDKYLNIYIVKNAAGLAGHCVWPADADSIPAWDGIVIGYNYVGSIGTSTYTQSVAFAHECGHYLNLQHIWGGNNVPGFYFYPCADTAKDCSIDDLVADTPPTIGWQSCNLAGASCGNAVDNVQNTMDYSYCNRMFTFGQKARMQACLNSPIAGRNNLWQTSNLIATGVQTIPGPLCKADFTSNKTVVCPGGTAGNIIFTNTSYNGTFTSILWTFPGGTPASSTAANPTIAYSSPGKYAVTLKVINGTDTVEVSKPDLISVLSTTGTVYPYSEGFETTSSLDGLEWFSNSLDTVNAWQLTNTAAFSGSKSVMLNNFNNTMDTKDELYSPIINLSGATTMNISFKYAYAKKDSSSSDRLQLYVSNNCNTTWIQRLNLISPALETAPLTGVSFTPASTLEWKQGAASIPVTYMTSSFRFKFVYTSMGGNNVFIDDINLDVNAGINDISDLSSSLQLFPNPASEQVNISFVLEQSRELDFSILNMMGQTVYHQEKVNYSAGEHTITVDTKKLAAGAYFMNIADKESSLKKPLIIIAR
ncbi:MAG TPA: M43 family zinc metalloprotease [Bacteroidia bacterium]|jgi:PKD repeat protein